MVLYALTILGIGGVEGVVGESGETPGKEVQNSDDVS